MGQTTRNSPHYRHLLIESERPGYDPAWEQAKQAVEAVGIATTGLVGKPTSIVCENAGSFIILTRMRGTLRDGAIWKFSCSIYDPRTASNPY